MKKQLLISFLMVFLLSAKDQMEFFLDFNTFSKTGSDKQAVEIYFSVPVKSLKYDDSLRASFSVNVKVFEDNKLIASDLFGQYSFLKTTNDLKAGGEAPSQTILQLKPGTYRLKAVVTDLTSKDSAVIDIPQSSGKFTIKDIDTKMNISGIQIGSKIIPDGKTGNQFYKNGISVVPNPRKLFGTHNPFLSYYAELYNLEPSKEYRLNWEIYTPEGKFIRKGDQPIKVIGSAGYQAVFDKVKIYYLKSGSYNFLLRLSDKADTDSVYKSNNFYIYRSIDFEHKTVHNDSLGDYYDIWSAEKIEDEMEQVSCILNKAELNTVSQLNENGKRNFLKKFWQNKYAKDPDSYNNFLYLVQLASQDYGTVNIKGWKTDRGRILIKMGEPDKKDQIVMSKSVIDHEIWSYYNSNNKFVFADFHSLGDYKLIHSDYSGEKSDPNWESKLKKRSKGGSIDMGNE